jgi:hypothetical protein
MSITPTQAGTIRAIVNLFETGHVLGDYGQVTVIASADAVAAHQRGRGLPATGVADIPLIAELTVAV